MTVHHDRSPLDRHKPWVPMFRLAGILAIIVSIWLTGYFGRKDLVASQRAGCARGKLDRAANARGWRTAEAARRADGQEHVARLYAKLAAGLEARARIDCRQVYPAPRLLQFRERR